MSNLLSSKLLDMAEAPPPPLNLSYNEFRSWRKNNGITSTKEELSVLWQEYSASNKATKKSPIKKSPIKKSPSYANVIIKRSPGKKSPGKSPLKYGGLSSANLLGLPPDVRRIVSTKLGEGSVRSMLISAKGTTGFVEQQLQELCKEPLSQLEILNGLDSIPLPIGIRIKDSYSDTADIFATGELLLISRDQDNKKRVEWLEENKIIVDYITNTTTKPIKTYIENRVAILVRMGQNIVIEVSLKTLYALYMRRKSCMRVGDAGKYVENIMVLSRTILIIMARQEYRDIAPNEHTWLPIQEMITGERDPQSWTRIILFDHAVRYKRRARRVAWITSDSALVEHAGKLYAQIIRKQVPNSKKVEKLRELAILTVESLRTAYMLL